jgi:exopolysaccharide biosynthesis polyprenyl glycosylphosphotransferase
MLRQFSTRRIIGSFAMDWLGTIAILYIAAYLRAFLFQFQWGASGIEKALINIFSTGRLPDYLITSQILMMVGVIWAFFFSTLSVYDGRSNNNLREELLNVIFATVTCTLVLAGALFLTYRETSRGFFLIFFSVDLIYLVAWRIAWHRFFSKFSSFHRTRRRVLIIGAGPVGQNVAAEIRKYGERTIDIVGFVDDNPQKYGDLVEGYPVFGTLDNIIDVIEAREITDTIVALPLKAHQRIIEMAGKIQKNKNHVHIIPDLFALTFPNATLDGFGGIPLIDLGYPGLKDQQRFLKRVFDVIVSSFCILITSPVMLVVSLLIKLDSKGPILYQQTRIGENGQLFTMLKFRSMKTNSDPNIHKAYVTRLIEENISPETKNSDGEKSLKMEADPRITSVGRFIRKTSIDELPQFFNVLRGEMSLVGPRPSLPYEVDVYKDWHKRRFDTPPGITGIWQVTARNQVSFDEMVRLDIEYIEKYSIWLDIKLILQTPWALLNAKGAG